jgi:Rv2525c-like, glycoside hydrolase-like domain
MNAFRYIPASTLLLASVGLLLTVTGRTPGEQPKSATYLGFDSNEYPGDDALPILRKTFAFTSYWIGPPPGEKRSTWLGKRALLHGRGFGFVVLFNGRTSRTLKSAIYARQMGFFDGDEAVKLAHGEGFSAGTLIFLDVEEGGRLTSAYYEYVGAWIDTLEAANFRAGVYCSGVPVAEGELGTITTAKDLLNNLGGRKFTLWVFNDVCPPSPGCVFPQNPPALAQSCIPAAKIWQYAQSPRQKQRTARCSATYAGDGNCYAPGDTAHKWFLDANVASTPNPSAPN